MKSGKIIASALVLPFLGITYFVSASFDCSTLDNDTVKTILDKAINNETLTTDEQETLENIKSCLPTGSGSDFGSGTMFHMKGFGGMGSGMTMSGMTLPTGSGSDFGSGTMFHMRGEGMGSGMTMSGMTDEQITKMEEIKTIMEKKKNGETLTSDEESELEEFEANKPTMGTGSTWSGSINKVTTTDSGSSSKINSSYKSKIDTAVNKLFDTIDNYSEDSDKLTVLSTLQTKIDSKKTEIDDSSSISDSTKSTYDGLLDYILGLVENKINKINGVTDDSNADNLIEDIFQ